MRNRRWLPLLRRRRSTGRLPRHTRHGYAEHLHHLLQGLYRVQHLSERILFFTAHRLADLVYRLGYTGIVLELIMTFG